MLQKETTQDVTEERTPTADTKQVQEIRQDRQQQRGADGENSRVPMMMKLDVAVLPRMTTSL